MVGVVARDERTPAGADATRPVDQECTQHRQEVLRLDRLAVLLRVPEEAVVDFLHGRLGEVGQAGKDVPRRASVSAPREATAELPRGREPAPLTEGSAHAAITRYGDEAVRWSLLYILLSCSTGALLFGAIVRQHGKDDRVEGDEPSDTVGSVVPKRIHGLEYLQG